MKEEHGWSKKHGGFPFLWFRITTTSHLLIGDDLPVLHETYVNTVFGFAVQC